MKALELINSTQGMSVALKEKINNMLPSATPIDHLASLINLINAEAKALKNQEQKLASDRKFLESLIALAERSTIEEMQEEGLVEITGQLVKYAVRLNPHKLIIENESLIPDEYKHEVVTLEIKKDAIKDDLKLGAEIPGCKLTQDLSLQLKANS